MVESWSKESLNKSYYHSVTDLRGPFLVCTTPFFQPKVNYNSIGVLLKLLFCAMILAIIFTDSVCH